MTKIYCTKWAVNPKVFTARWRKSHGIVEYDVEKEVSPEEPFQVVDGRLGWVTLRLGRNAFLTRKEAEQDVLKKAQAHLRGLRFRVEQLEQLREVLLQPLKENQKKMEQFQEKLKP